MSPEFAYVMEELMVEHRRADKKRYVEQILETIIMTGRVRQFIAAMAHLIQDLTIDHLHVIGDIYDRGSGPHRIMDCIMKTANVDIQWGNHDILWMGVFNAIKSVFKKGQNLDGDIVLMHDIQDSTPKAVANIVKYLDKKGYQLVTVSELAYYRNTTMKNGETYSCFYPTTNYSQKRNNSNTNSNQTEFSTNQSNNSNNTTNTTVANNQNVVTDNTTPTVD